MIRVILLELQGWEIVRVHPLERIEIAYENDNTNVVLVDDEDEEKDIIDDNYTWDGEDANEGDDSDFRFLVFVTLLKYVKNHFNHHELCLLFVPLSFVLIFISFVSSRLHYWLIELSCDYMC